MLTISTTRRPATDLGFILHKNPVRTHDAELAFGVASVVYPEASEERCTAALVVDIDPIALVRGKGEGAGGSLSQYVNDRPYVASSFLSVAINRVFGTAMSGRCKDKPELAEQELPLEIVVPVLPSRGGESAIRELFEPMGYTLEVRPLPLDEAFAEWGTSPYFHVTLSGGHTVRAALSHLYVLLPVLDARKHYYFEKTEVDKLLRRGEGWLSTHPRREWIVRSYLGRRPSLMREALEQLANVEPELEVQEADVDSTFVSLEATEEPAAKVKRISLHDQRHERIVELIRTIQPNSVIDLGCGEGRLIRKLIPVQGIQRIVGMDVSYYELEKAERKLHLEAAGPKMRERVELLHGSLMYGDPRLSGFDVATVVEVIEHLDPPRLHAFERVVFGVARPKVVLLTTPNREYNAVYEKMEGFRHQDHRFEWTRAECEAWAKRVADLYRYTVTIEGIGETHEEHGPASMLAVFRS